MSSNDNIKAGRVTTRESTTVVLGALPSEQDVNFNGTVVLRVASQPGDLSPNMTLDGIHGVGHNGTQSSGGVGVVGFGGPRDGTGVLGLGGGDGEGGIGVHGIGGSSNFAGFTPNGPPGAGVVALGGRMYDNTNTLRVPHGAGVIAIAGGNTKPIPALIETGSIGVYAQGAEAEVRTSNIDGVDTVVGPAYPGVGVLARGGMPVPRGENKVAAGVVGLAGDTAIPPISETGNSGVYGAGWLGVFGHGVGTGVRGKSEQSNGIFGETVSGAGVYGFASETKGRAGVFQSERSAQVSLVPQNQPTQFSTPVAASPTVIPAGREGPRLPKDGRGGDLMTIADQQGQCTLWFCVKGEGPAGPALWAQILLGPSFNGQA
jgi:hypothetical protein